MKKTKNFIILIIIILTSAYILTYFLKSSYENIQKIPEIQIIKTEKNTESFSLIKIIDGDTIKVKDNKNNIENIRMIGIDAPEASSTRYGYTECFGIESTKHLEFLLSGAKEIIIEFDSTQATRDKYGRLLGYVIYNGENINKKMIEDGYCFEYTYNLPYKYQKEFKLSEKIAKINNKGLRNQENCSGERTIY